MNILIVDDNASMRSLLATLLASQGHQVVGQLEDGNRVIEAIRRTRPAVVCLDYLLPGRDGLDILAEINTGFPEIDVVFMTASEDEAIEQRAADYGAAGFLRKPFGQKQVLDELQQIAAARQAAQAGSDPDSAPAAAAAATAAPGAPTPAPRRENGGRPTAVIVDDNGSIRLLLKGVVTELGLNVVAQAANGEEAIRAALQHQPQVLFLDVNMPVLSGVEALPKIRAASPETAVVMVTGDTSRKLVEQVAALGARGYVVKPIRPAYVENFLKRLFTP
ncbi:response regulator [Azonexus caeni]|uniref:response regulator n=1 Tax=Azonexus caeni TaxID=266126 RepID=UPI003A878DFD